MAVETLAATEGPEASGPVVSEGKDPVVHPVDHDPISSTGPAVLTLGRLREWIAAHDQLPEQTLILGITYPEDLCEPCDPLPSQTVFGLPELAHEIRDEGETAEPVVLLLQVTTGPIRRYATDTPEWD